MRAVALQLSAVGALLPVLTADADLRHRYTFSQAAPAGGTFQDEIGNADGTLFGNATISGGALILPGGGAGLNGDHAKLLASGPDGINIGTYTNASIALWATLTDANPDDWERYFDIGYQNDAGNSAGNSIFLTSDAGGSTGLRFGISNAPPDAGNGAGYEQQLNTMTVPSPFPSRHHVVVTFDGANDVGRMYLNGAVVATNTVMTHMLELLDFPGVPGPDRTDFALLGAGLYNADQNFEGTITQFEIYDRALTSSEVANLYVVGPNPCGDCGCGAPCVDAARLTINRDDGSMTLSRFGSPLDVASYLITSVNGALNPAAWQTIAENFDATSGGEFDSDDEWSVLSPAGSKFDFSEAAPDGESGTFSAAFEVPLGAPGAWRKSIYEDVLGQLALADETIVPLLIRYTGNNDVPFQRSDLNFDGSITDDDWAIYLLTAPTVFTGMSPTESYAFGDLNGDLKSDFADFRLFKADYLEANSGAGAAMFDAFELSTFGVPEPASLLLLLIAACLSCSRRPRRG